MGVCGSDVHYHKYGRIGRYVVERALILANPPYDGAFAEYVAMPASFVYAIPDSISDDAAGLLEPLSVGIWACRRSAVDPDARVLVTGAGPIGLIAAQVARAYGAPAVAVTDVVPQRLALAERLGLLAINVAETAVRDIGFEPDVLLECSGNPRAPGTPSLPLPAPAESCSWGWAVMKYGYPCPTFRIGS